MKIKDLNPPEEGDFPCQLRWLGPSEQEFHGEYSSSNLLL